MGKQVEETAQRVYKKRQRYFIEKIRPAEAE